MIIGIAVDVEVCMTSVDLQRYFCDAMEQNFLKKLNDICCECSMCHYYSDHFAFRMLEMPF